MPLSKDGKSKSLAPAYISFFAVNSLILLSLPFLLAIAIAQPPRWDMRIYFMPEGPPTDDSGDPRWLQSYGDIFFPGETGNLTFQVTNIDCERRAQTPHVREFQQTWEEDLRPVFRRLEAMSKTNFITGYSVEDSNVVVFGDRKIADWRITVTGYCIGRQVDVVSAKVWFAWPRYGEAISSKANIGRTLKSLDPLKYIFEGDITESTVLFTVAFPFPSDLPSELFEQQPVITLELRYPSRFTYEYEYSVSGQEDLWQVLGIKGGEYGFFRLSPFRTFNLTITDHEYALRLDGAQLVLKAHFYSFSTTAFSDREGAILIRRLPDFYSYDVTVIYRVPLIRQNITVYISSHSAEELARTGYIRTSLYTLRIQPKDMNGRPLINATVDLKLIEEPRTGATAFISNSSTGGYATFYLLPTGNYSVEVTWKSVKVHSSQRYVGYHPTLGFSPLTFEAETSVADLVVSATDMSGAPVGAVFDVEGPTPETSFRDLSRRDGVLVLEQQPIAQYRVTATNASSVFNFEASASIVATPGEPSQILLPIYNARFRLLSMDGKPLHNSTVRFHTLEFRSDRDGALSIPGVPGGVYSLRAYYRDVPVYSGEVRVAGNVLEEIYVAVFDVNMSLVDWDGRPIIAEWVIEGAGGRFAGVGSRLAAELLPNTDHRVLIYFWERGTPRLVLNSSILPSESRTGSLRLQISPAKFRVFWSGGEPFNGTVTLNGVTYALSNGVAQSDPLRHGALNISVLGWGGTEILRQEIMHNGTEIKLVIQQTVITVSVSDILSRPVQDARVVVYSGRRPGLIAGADSTGPEGSVSFIKLPTALAPYRVEVSYGDEKFEVWTAGGVLRVRLNSLVLAGVPIPGSTILASLLGVLSVALAAALIQRIRARLRQRGGEE